ncbi:PQQ-like beta-propeller repeat protein [Actinoplanes sp. TRM 88003]|uniref:PQQ-like beta-propeller repeat protein n=1 Tax=Paractinoplanes aksuensis TaxID=2939490 RepID=A0ABT1DS15_9ACTN|nr:PQQ-like beta-propeller repeat protein [Actinoplanes aksuensis]MCO8272800.1 PQQ-like beta-propeller repeat protein [Actinoplanes aksuensis]
MTGKLYPLYTRDKKPVPEGAEEQMQGRGRQAVYSADRQTLYTLYTHQPEHQHTRNLLNGTRNHVHAFVHVLHLAERWAYCLDLPDPFGRGPAEGHALAVDGNRLAVLDTASGSIAHADTETLQIERVARIPAGRGPGSLAYSADARLFVADGNAVHALDRNTDQTAATWVLSAPVRGLRLSTDGARLYAGGQNEVVWLDAASGELRGRARVGGLTDLLSVK